jgi:hypothetical protein
MVGSSAGLAVSLTPRRFYQSIRPGASAMDMIQVFIIYAGWFFFTAWGMVLAAVSVVAFGRDLIPTAQSTTVEKERP